MESDVTELEIQQRLLKRYSLHKGCQMIMFNAFIFAWESDMFFQTRAGYSYEIEVKTCLSDYNADFKKQSKHRRLSQTIRRDTRKCPNRFFYALPIDIAEQITVPEYAGLIGVHQDKRRRPRVLKKAPTLHKQKHDYTKELIVKYQWSYINLFKQQ